jgi:hypothetical protein
MNNQYYLYIFLFCLYLNLLVCIYYYLSKGSLQCEYSCTMLENKSTFLCECSPIDIIKLRHDTMELFKDNFINISQCVSLVYLYISFIHKYIQKIINIVFIFSVLFKITILLYNGQFIKDGIDRTM